MLVFLVPLESSLAGGVVIRLRADITVIFWVIVMLLVISHDGGVIIDMCRFWCWEGMDSSEQQFANAL